MIRLATIEKLKQELALGNVVTIAGTGVSVIACGNQQVSDHRVATWLGLLEHGVAYCQDRGLADSDDIAVLTMQLRNGKTRALIGAAEELSDRMIGGVFRGWLKDTIGELKYQHRDIIDAIAALPGILATLNYDSLIEQVTDRCPVTWLQADKVQDVLGGRLPKAVLHLHGYYDEPDSVVLGLRSYLKVADDAHAATVLKSLAIDRTILFVGCGDTVLDPNFTRLIEWGKIALKDIQPRHYLLCRTDQIIDFQEKLSAAPWLQPLAYGDIYENLVPFLKSLVPAGGAMPPFGPVIPARVDFTAYQKVIHKIYHRLKFEELVATDSPHLKLIGMFIEQNAKECATFMQPIFELPKELQLHLRATGEIEDNEFDDDLIRQRHRSYLEQPARPILDILDDPACDRLVILGDPGSGKSTLLQYVLLRWSENNAAAATFAPLPLLIELREYARLRACGETSDFLAFLASAACVRFHFDQALLAPWLEANASVVLFDGLDEIFDPDLRREIVTSIHRFADRYPRTRIIVTSRIIGYQHHLWSDEGFRQFLLQDLNKIQIGSFLTRWHSTAYEDDKFKGEAKRTLLAGAIDDSPAIAQLAGNPLLLTMMAILNRTQDLPRDRSQLYAQCTRLLLFQWEAEMTVHAGPGQPHFSLDFEDKRRLLLRVAGTMQASPLSLAGNLIDENALTTTLAAGLASIIPLSPESVARALIEQLRGRNFMLCFMGGKSYSFVHRTLLEYFCAVEICERFEKTQTLSIEQLKTDIFGHWQDEAWHEVLCLLIGMIDGQFVEQILTWLLEQADPEYTCQHVFLAIECVGEVKKRTKLGAVELRVMALAKELTKFELPYYYELWGDEAQAVRAIRVRAIILFSTVWPEVKDNCIWVKERAISDKYGDVSQTALRQLIRSWKDDPDTLPWLKEHTQFGANWIVRQCAVQELVRGWKNDPYTLPMLKDRALTDENSIVRESALQELARGWKDAPDILRMLKNFALSDDNKHVRQIVLRELAWGWKDDPETLRMLKDNALNDDDRDLRWSALQELIRGWKDDPDTLRILKDRAVADDDEDVRGSALQELARGWKDDPVTLQTLKDRALADDNGNVRRSALKELVRGWKNAPDTLSWLKGHAQSGADWFMRQSAMQELARGWKDDPDTLHILKDRALSDEDYAVRGSALQELARGWKNEPDTLRMLKDRALADDVHVHQIVVRELARGWKDDPDTLRMLKEDVEFGTNWSVRDSAMHELVQRWKDDPDTLRMLKDRALSDDDQVRTSTMVTLAQGWKDDPDTLLMLKKRALSDENRDIRRSAMMILARGWNDDPDTLRVLRDRALTDDDDDVRRSAIVTLARAWKDDPDTLRMLKNLRMPKDRVLAVDDK